MRPPGRLPTLAGALAALAAAAACDSSSGKEASPPPSALESCKVICAAVASNGCDGGDSCGCDPAEEGSIASSSRCLAELADIASCYAAGTDPSCEGPLQIDACAPSVERMSQCWSQPHDAGVIPAAPDEGGVQDGG